MLYKGYIGRVLFVDLSNRKSKSIQLEESMCKDFLGGYGIGAQLIYNFQKPNVDPLNPESIIGFITGPLTGTPAVGGCRWMVVGKSPLTKTWGDSNCGGYFGPALKMAGYDGVFIRGIADQPVYLFVDEGNLKINDAKEIWGKNTYEVEQILKNKFGKNINVASIGKAGEKLVLIANIIHDGGRAAGRCGFGALMGSKKLKAIVVKGKKKIPVACPEKALDLRKKAILNMKESVLFKLFGKGSIHFIPSSISTGDAPTKNWFGVGQEDFPQGINWSEEELDKYKTKRYTCWKCPVGCGGKVKMVNEQYNIPESRAPEYETVAVFGSNCLNSNLESIIKLNDVCNSYGVDVISAGGLISFIIDCFERKIITKRDTDGLEMKWGDYKTMIGMLEKIVNREGIGNILADGLEKAAKYIGKGAERYAIHIRGEAIPMHDPRFEPAMALIYKINPSPAKHTYASQYTQPPGLNLQIPAWGTERQKQKERAKGIKILEALNNSNSCAGLCIRPYLMYDVQFLPKFLSAVTGKNWSLEELITVGEKIANMKIAFNIREGVNVFKEHFPSIVLGDPPLKKGPLKEVTVDLDLMVDEYLKRMDWERESGKPSKKKLIEQGLDNIANELYG